MTSLLYAGNKQAGDGNAKLEVASGFVALGSIGVFTAAEQNNLANLYFLEVPGSGGVVVVNGPPTVQTITIYDWPGDSIVLTFGGQSAVCPTNSTGSSIQTALQALSSIGAGNCTVTGPQGGPFVVTFAGTLAGAVQAAIVASGTDASATPETSHSLYPTQ